MIKNVVINFKLLYTNLLIAPSMETMKGLSRCYDPDSAAGGSVATGRATLAGKVDGEPRTTLEHVLGNQGLLISVTPIILS